MESYLASLGRWVSRLLTFGVFAVLSCSFIRWMWEEAKLGRWEKEHKATIRELSREEPHKQ